MVFSHKSVLLDEVIESLNIKPDGYYVDGTLGGGGHALEVVKRLEGGKLIGIDQDADAIKAATQRLIDYRNRVIIVRDNYVNIENILKREGKDEKKKRYNTCIINNICSSIFNNCSGL